MLHDDFEHEISPTTITEVKLSIITLRAPITFETLMAAFYPAMRRIEAIGEVPGHLPDLFTGGLF